jgi:hypothetical protein
MIDTLLQIGKTFREAKRLRHHRYIKPAPIPDKKTTITFLSLPVTEDFRFDFDGIKEIPENERSLLFYPTFKTSDADGLVKYLFGDIYYGLNKDGKELGYYRMGDSQIKAKGFQVSSFFRCEEDARFFDKSDVIIKFRNGYKKNIKQIQDLLKENSREMVFLHFDFQGKHWYHFEEEMKLINEKIFKDFLGFSKKANGYVLNAFLFKTLGGDTPMFNSEAKYKNRYFESTDNVLDLIYAIDYSKKAIITEKNIKIVVLPKGENISAVHIEEFFEKKSTIEDVQVNAAEEKIKDANSTMSEQLYDSLFMPVTEGISRSIVQFDFVFSKKADSPSTPDVDMLEISGIERSLLTELSERIKEIRRSFTKERNKLYPKRPKNFINLEIRNAFRNILGDTTKGQKKYQSHLFKVLPQIYTGTYYNDDVLLPAFIEKIEFNIRNDQENYNLLKYDYYFLTKSQNSIKDKIMEMNNSLSYKAGLLLGKMAKPLSCKINSFEKNYVGLLSRRISDKKGLMDFSNFINEKLAIHDVAYPDLRNASVEFASLVSQMNEKEYLKNECAFGFFESYFKYEQKKDAEGITKSFN